MTSDFYPALQKDSCTLVTWPIARIHRAPGRRHRVRDGIRRVEDRHAGPDGRILADKWSTGAQAYKSIAASGYPNMYFTFGPNSGQEHRSALVYTEAQIDYRRRNFLRVGSKLHPRCP